MGDRLVLKLSLAAPTTLHRWTIRVIKTTCQALGSIASLQLLGN